MRKTLLVGILTVLATVPVSAQEDVVTPQQLANNPNDYIRTDIVLKGMSCALDGEREITCVLSAPNQSIVVNALVFGWGTSPADTLKFNENCSGTSSYNKAFCQFDVRVVPQSIIKKMAQTTAGTKPMIIVTGQELDIMTAKPRKK